MITLPRPFSVNAATKNAGNKGRRKTPEYEAWCRESDMMILAQRPEKFPGKRVRLHYNVGTSNVNVLFDLGNCEKAYTDALVRGGVITDDRRKYVQSIHLEWTKGLDGCHATVIPIGDAKE